VKVQDCTRVHALKILPRYFAAIQRGTKTFEVRKNDRNFAEADTLMLREWSDELGYTGRTLRVRVNYIMHGGQFGLEEGYCVMAIAPEMLVHNHGPEVRGECMEREGA